MRKNVSVIIPSYNAGAGFARVLAAVKKCPETAEILVIDSGSTDGTAALAKKAGAKVTVIDKADFDHGGTRTFAGKKAGKKILVYLTQDAVPAGADSIKKLIEPLLKNKKIAASYGRQLPLAGATPFAAHLRMFNYPAEQKIKFFKDRGHMGIKAAFMSNSFAAYKKSVLERAGWFKDGFPMGEDVRAGAVLLKAGFGIAYTPAAKVFHSHNYGMLQEFRRYFDIGYFYKREKWILEEFGAAESEGVKFVKSEMKYLAGCGKGYLIPFSLVRAAMKYAGYKAGQVKAAMEPAPGH